MILPHHPGGWHSCHGAATGGAETAVNLCFTTPTHPQASCLICHSPHWRHATTPQHSPPPSERGAVHTGRARDGPPNLLHSLNPLLPALILPKRRKSAAAEWASLLNAVVATYGVGAQLWVQCTGLYEMAWRERRRTCWAFQAPFLFVFSLWPPAAFFTLPPGLPPLRIFCFLPRLNAICFYSWSPLFCREDDEGGSGWWADHQRGLRQAAAGFIREAEGLRRQLRRIGCDEWGDWMRVVLRGGRRRVHFFCLYICCM